jgi:hypothetical protein
MQHYRVIATSANAGPKGICWVNRRRHRENAGQQFFPHSLYALRAGLISPPSGFREGPLQGVRMQKQALKIRLPQDETGVSDGYYVFISLISTVALITSSVVVAFAVEMLR